MKSDQHSIVASNALEKSYFALSVGPNASRAKLLGNSGFPGPRSPTGSYKRSLSLSPKSDPAELWI